MWALTGLGSDSLASCSGLIFVTEKQWVKQGEERSVLHRVIVRGKQDNASEMLSI